MNRRLFWLFSCKASYSWRRYPAIRIADEASFLANKAGIELRQSYPASRRVWRSRSAVAPMPASPGACAAPARGQCRPGTPGPASAPTGDPGGSPAREGSGRPLLAGSLLEQGPPSHDKLHSLHAPEVDCISKGKARMRGEICTRVSLATPQDRGFVVGTRSAPGNPMTAASWHRRWSRSKSWPTPRPTLAVVDRGYRGQGAETTRVLISASGTASPRRRRSS